MLLILKFIDSFLFLGEGEYNFAVNKYKKHNNKFKFINFGIDTEFWKADVSKPQLDRDYILFIGNDLNRDYKLLIDIINLFPELNFKVLSKYVNENDFLNKNVQVLNGVWWENTYTDEEIKELYNNAKFTILPLKDTHQPSGQSVAMQSMCIGTPVLISKQKGFGTVLSLIIEIFS